jgi:hypothetical protein
VVLAAVGDRADRGNPAEDQHPGEDVVAVDVPVVIAPVPVMPAVPVLGDVECVGVPCLSLASHARQRGSRSRGGGQ